VRRVKVALLQIFKVIRPLNFKKNQNNFSAAQKKNECKQRNDTGELVVFPLFYCVLTTLLKSFEIVAAIIPVVSLWS
jgi:hypothetical protein